MQKVYALTLMLCASTSLVGGCTPGGFEVQPCSLNGRLAFHIDEIEGWFSDYQPRPMKVLVTETTGPRSGFPGVWSAEFLYYSAHDNGFKRRPARKLIVYGQRLPGWDLTQAAQPLRPGTEYQISIDDGGYTGYVTFTSGKPLLDCS